MISTFEKPGRCVVVDVASAPVTVSCSLELFDDVGETFGGMRAVIDRRIEINGRKVNPEFVLETLRGILPGTDKIVPFEEGETLVLNRRVEIAEDEDEALAKDELKRIAAACRGRRDRRERRVLRRSVRRARPVLRDEQGRFAGYGPRKPAPKTGDVSGRKPRHKDVTRVRLMVEAIPYAEPCLDLYEDDGLEDLGMVSSDVIVCEEAMMWAVEYNDDDEWIEAIRPTLEMIAA